MLYRKPCKLMIASSNSLLPPLANFTSSPVGTINDLLSMYCFFERLSCANFKEPLRVGNFKVLCNSRRREFSSVCSQRPQFSHGLVCTEPQGAVYSFRVFEALRNLKAV